MMRRLLIALMALVMLGGVAGAAMASNNVKDSAAEARAEKDNPNPPGEEPGCKPSGEQPQKCCESEDGTQQRGSDRDKDDICDDNDNCPDVANPGQEDSNENGIGDACEETDECADLGGDADEDGICDDDDNCADDANAGQEDADEDGIGDACDDCDGDNADTDGDGVCDGEDNCDAVENADQADTDEDGIGDACEGACDNVGDGDGDGVCDDVDNCPAAANADQADADDDGIGDACDPACDDLGGDTDGDGVCNDTDNCDDVSNADQADADDDGVGDACEPAEFDPCSNFGLVEARTIAQILWDAGLQIPFLTEDPDHDGLVSGALVNLLKGTPLENTPIDQLVLEVSCLADFLIEHPEIPLDV